MDGPDNLVLAMLRRMDAKLDRISSDLGDLKVPMTGAEEAIAGVNRRLDRLDGRISGSKSASIWWRTFTAPAHFCQLLSNHPRLPKRDSSGDKP